MVCSNSVVTIKSNGVILRGGFFACYDRVWELVNLRNDKQHYQEGFFVFDIATFNERVVREAILNAVSHRNYQFGGSIFVRQFRDRLVVALAARSTKCSRAAV